MSFSFVIDDLQYALCNSMLSWGSQIMVQTETAISMVLGVVLLAIGVPFIGIFALDFMAYVSSMAAQSFSLKILTYSNADARFLVAPASVGLVFNISSPGAVKQIFQRLGSVKLTPPKAGFWLTFSEEEH